MAVALTDLLCQVVPLEVLEILQVPQIGGVKAPPVGLCRRAVEQQQYIKMMKYQTNSCRRGLRAFLYTNHPRARCSTVQSRFLLTNRRVIQQGSYVLGIPLVLKLDPACCQTNGPDKQGE